MNINCLIINVSHVNKQKLTREKINQHVHEENRIHEENV